MLKSFLPVLLILIPAAAMAQDASPPAPPAPPAATTEQVVPFNASEKPLDIWMQKKLEYSTAILRGLSLGDFELIEANANQMRLLNKIERFVRNRNPEYRAHVHTFEEVTNEIIRQAKKKNIDGVTLGFHQLTVSCVRCHQSLRNAE